ncbi:MAG: diphthine--ammonia ligase [Desulfobacteraceae bacterium]|nr:MAG: diphthine--ammonia ligase [Desulfobacteraceae bacterium]
MKPIKDIPFFCSWSGGKDSCLALYHAIQAGGKPRFLLTILDETGERSRSHALPVALLEKQAQALGIPIVTRSASWDDYEKVFIETLPEFKRQGVQFGVFGDIDLEDHLAWCRRVCGYTGIETYHPLWQRERSDLLNEFIGLGFKATIISVKQGILSTDFLGKTIDKDFIAEVKNQDIDICGEKGEYHTVVTDGPIFAEAVTIKMRKQTLIDGYWFLEVVSE